MANELRIKDINELSGLFQRLENLLNPELPPKDNQLWEQFLLQAQEELVEQLKKRQTMFTIPSGRNFPPQKTSKEEHQKSQKQFEERIRQIAEKKYCEKDLAYAKAVDQAKSEAFDTLKRIDHLLLVVRAPLLQFPRVQNSLLVVDWKEHIRNYYNFLDKNSFSYQLREAIDVLESLKLQIEHQQPTKCSRRGAWFWKLYEKTLKVIVDAVLERWWPK